MCGIIGVFGEPSGKMTDVFTDMLQMDVVRGWDSTGALSVKNNGDWRVVKDTDLPQNLMIQGEFKAHFLNNLVRDKHVMLLGHNRWATKGGVNIANAHPFIHEPIVLVHNGTLTSYYRMNEGHPHFNTDSEAICWSIKERGIADTYKMLDGAATLVWWNLEEKRLNFLSNGKRTFFYAYTKGRKHIIWASEAWMIRSACQRNDVALEEDGTKIFKLDDHVHWQFHTSRRHKVIGERAELDPFVYVAPSRPSAGYSFNLRSLIQGEDDDSEFAAMWPNARSRGEYDSVKDNWMRRFQGVYGRAPKEGEMDIHGMPCEECRRHIIDVEIAVRIDENRATRRYDLDTRTGEKKPVPFRRPIYDDKGRQVGTALEKQPANSVPALLAAAHAARKEQLEAAFNRDHVEDFTQPTLEQLKEKDIPETIFHQMYERCSGCNEPLQYEYEESVILDDDHAICGSCAATCEKEGVPMIVAINQ